MSFEQLLAIFFSGLGTLVFISIFLPSVAEKVGARLKLSRWTPLDDDNLLLFVMLMPIWALWGATQAYFGFIQKFLSNADATGGLVIVWSSGLFYIYLVYRVVGAFLPLEKILLG